MTEEIDVNDGPGSVDVHELVLDQSDFETSDAYQSYLNRHSSVPKISASKTEGTTQEVVATTKTGATKVFTLEGLPYTNVVQAAYVGTSNIYAVQYVKSEAKQVISRCVISGSTATTDSSKKMVLKNFGHGQTLQYFTHNSTAYFWVVCKATTLQAVDNGIVDQQLREDVNWGIQVGRIEYSDGGSHDSYTEIPRISNINAANKAGTAYGSILRCDAALSSSGDYLMIWMKNTAGHTQHSYYDAGTINTLLDAKESETSKYIMCTSDNVKAACVDYHQFPSFTVPSTGTASYQGFEFSDGLATYISSGDYNGGEETSDSPVIGKYSWGSSTPGSKVTLTSTEISNRPNDHEIEGIQLKGDYVYVNMTFHASVDGTQTVSHVIYTVPKTAF